MSGPVNVYTQGTGTASIAQPITLSAAPGPTLNNYPLGQIAVVQSSNTAYILSSKTTSNGVTSANWTTIATAAGDIDTITTDDSTVVTPTAGNVNLVGASVAAGTSPVATSGSGDTATINVQISQAIASTDATKIGLCNFDSSSFSVDANGFVALKGGSEAVDSFTPDTGTDPVLPTSGGLVSLLGTANQITTTGGTNKITWSLPAAITAPGSLLTTTTLASTTTLTGGTGITATTGDITATNGNVVLNTAGNKLVIATGANASVGVSSAMSGTPGAVTVATTACSATAKVFYCRATTGGTPGEVSITAQDGTGFTLTSTGNETSTFNWWIIND